MTVPFAVLGLVGYAVATQPHAHERSFSGGNAETTLSAAEIYDRLRDGAMFTGLEKARVITGALARKYERHVLQIESLRTRTAEHWTGSASDSALRYSQPFSDALRDAGDELAAIASENGPLARQFDAYQRVLADVQKLPAAPPESGIINTITPFETDTDREINAYNATAERNVAAYMAYYNASGDNGLAMPQAFPTPPDTTVPSVVVLPQSGQASTFSAQAPGVPVGTGHVPPAAAPSAAVASVGGPPAVARGGEPGSTTRQNFSPGATSVPPPVVGTPQSSAGGTGGVPFGVAPGGGSGGGAGRPGSGRPGVSTGRLGAGTGGPGGGSGRPGGRSGGSGGPGGGSGSGGSGSGARGAGGMGEQLGRKTVPGMSSMDRSALPGERAGSAGVGSAAGRPRKDNEDDKERSTKYILSEDLDLGLDGPVAPPVIGDTR